MDETTLRLRITGRVQGVAFRDWTVREAMQRGLRGWVRNRQDGSVEALVTGPAASVEDMVQACNRGPSLARVVSVDVVPDRDDGSAGFRRVPTA
jgi:acylphosphatase